MITMVSSKFLGVRINLLHSVGACKFILVPKASELSEDPCPEVFVNPIVPFQTPLSKWELHFWCFSQSRFGLLGLPWTEPAKMDLRLPLGHVSLEFKLWSWKSQNAQYFQFRVPLLMFYLFKILIEYCFRKIIQKCF